MLRDDSFAPLSHTSGMPSPPASDNSDPHSPQQHTFDDLDDVFGSAPSSPSLLPSDHFIPSNTQQLNLSSTSIPTSRSRPNTEPSEIPRLRSAHSTAGYRDGIAVAKASKVQEGFDEGYNLGAVFGLRVGEVLGVLEGLYSAVKKNKFNTQSRIAEANGTASTVVDPDVNGGSAKGTSKEANAGKELDTEIERLWELVVQARRELKTEEVFKREWWGEDGIWRYEVPQEKEGHGEVTFKDVAAAHPGIRKWDAIVERECLRFGLVLGVLNAGEAQGID